MPVSIATRSRTPARCSPTRRRRSSSSPSTTPTTTSCGASTPSPPTPPSDIAVLVVDDGGADRRLRHVLDAARPDVRHNVVVLAPRAEPGLRPLVQRRVRRHRRPRRGAPQQRRHRRAGVAGAADRRARSATTPWPRRRTLTNHGTILSVPTATGRRRAARRHDARTRRPGGWRPAACGCARRSRPPSGTAATSAAHALDLVGGFDETFSPGYGEEVDFSQRGGRPRLPSRLRRRRVHVPPGRRQLRRRRRGRRRQARHEAIVRRRYPWYRAVGRARPRRRPARRSPTPSAAARRVAARA